jgi:hypothetical protein
MLATNPMPGNPSINTGSLSFGFSLISMVQTIVWLLCVGSVLEKTNDIRMSNLVGDNGLTGEFG